MMFLLYAILLIVIFRSLGQVGIGICQILLGLIAGLIGGLLYALALVLNGAVVLWTTAFPSQN